ncbi:MarR family winged helix-turn-helix transcriptional regulator [Streptomyces sp. CoH27]|uniref:MarR family winged helix-turn-helix transcriptional regulator n=1 Tax=Streptomyces sp. CoH27 TaxID=2875763 RepID=UPI001CD34022|nr:MarR family winged helix-turn-helix transcriptional regulator [Streptomyces sp. CoH27]
MDAPKPIGYWLKHLHNLLETQFETTLTDLGLGRRHWQVLNTLSRGKRTPHELREALAPFWAEGALDLGEVLDNLTERGWSRTEGDALALTEAGRTAHAKAAARIDETRATVLDGLTAEQYAETVRILSVMTRNVETALAARDDSRESVSSSSREDVQAESRCDLR